MAFTLSRDTAVCHGYHQTYAVPPRAATPALGTQDFDDLPLGSEVEGGPPELVL